jgi:hypothetical protein
VQAEAARAAPRVSTAPPHPTSPHTHTHTLCYRIWDTHSVLQKTVVKPATPSAARVGVTAVAYNSNGKLLAAGLMDGTLQVGDRGECVCVGGGGLGCVRAARDTPV